MTLWEPLPDTMSANARRLAVQLRRMKDRSGLAVPTLAARTSQSTESWERYLNGAKVPPRDAVEVLGQLCGADYERLGALWELADRGGGTYVPDPDPLDPLAPAEGLPKPHRWRKRLLVAGFGLVPASALGLLVLAGLTADSSTGRAQAPATSAPPASARTGTQLPGGLPVGTAPGGDGSGTPVSAARDAGPDAASASPVDGTSADTGTATSRAPGGGGTGTAAPPATRSATPTTAPTASASASPSASATSGGGLCLGVIIINVCVGG
ncbi:helix-turn-helix domain-containing protein [Streptomyces sp. NPDC059373]